MNDETISNAEHASQASAQYVHSLPRSKSLHMTENAIAGSANSSLGEMANPPLDRRCTSDSGLWRATTTRSAIGIPKYSKNATLNMAQRSNAQGVKVIISTIESMCEAASSNCASDNEVPDQECGIISQWANDAYYRVVIASYGGIPAIVQAMHTFANHIVLQVACCTALGNLCQRNGSNQMAVERHGGVTAIVAAMRMYPQSVAVQSAACEALRNMSGVLLNSFVQSNKEQVSQSDLVELLQRVKSMYITPHSGENADQLLLVLQAARQG